MKKTISVLSVLALLGLTSTAALAESITQDTTGSSGTTNVSYDIAPSYAIVIPSGISLESNQTVEIKMTGLTDTENPKLLYGQTVSVTLSNARNGFSGSDGKTLSLKDGSAAVSYTLTGANGKTGKDDMVASFKYDPNKTLDDYKQTLTFAVTSTVQYAGNYTDQLTFTISDGKVDISKLIGAYQAQDGDILTGKGNADTHITVADGATVILKDCDITAISNDVNHKWAGITFEGDGTILLEGTNKVKGGYEDYPGISVPENKTLTINGSGSLEAVSNGYGAGIGGGIQSSPCGNITISGGTVTANGGNRGAGAGIGSGYYSSCGDITISGSTVTANGGYGAAGIGSGYYQSSCKDVTINNTVIKVEAIKGENASNSIGAGKNSTCGTVTIEDGANVIQN